MSLVTASPPTLKHTFQTFFLSSPFWSPSPHYLLLTGDYLLFTSQEKWEMQVTVTVLATSFCLFCELAFICNHSFSSFCYCGGDVPVPLWTELFSLLLWIPCSSAFSGSFWIISSLSFISYSFYFLFFYISILKTSQLLWCPLTFFLSLTSKHPCRIICTLPPCLHLRCPSFPLDFSLASTSTSH